MSILRKAMCAAGRHQGDWSLPGGRCESVRVCPSCGTAEERARHVWGPYLYLADRRCDQGRRCIRCGAMRIRERHDWGPWRYADDALVTAQVHTCRRCHRTERTRRFSAI